MDNCDFIITKVLSIAYPFILLFGFYIIINGHQSPGGGFQGGAVLAAVFIIRYLIDADKQINLKLLQITEKALFLCLIALPISMVFKQNLSGHDYGLHFYMMMMNVLIGVKVCCGLTIIFYRFVVFESR